MGGTVDVKSTLGQGSTFIINIKTKCIIKKPNFNNNFNLKKQDKDKDENCGASSESSHSLSSVSDQNINSIPFIKCSKGQLTSKLILETKNIVCLLKPFTQRFS